MMLTIPSPAVIFYQSPLMSLETTIMAKPTKMRSTIILLYKPLKPLNNLITISLRGIQRFGGRRGCGYWQSISRVCMIVKPFTQRLRLPDEIPA